MVANPYFRFFWKKPGKPQDEKYKEFFQNLKLIETIQTKSIKTTKNIDFFLTFVSLIYVASLFLKLVIFLTQTTFSAKNLKQQKQKDSN